MTDDELDDCLVTMRWTPAILAEALGRKEAEIDSWLSGEKPIPLKTGAWLKAAAEAHMALETVKPRGRH